MIWPGVSLLPTTGPYVPDLDEAGRLYGLTFKQPYASCVIQASKRAENRDWPPYATIHGRPFWIAVHAGGNWYDGAEDSIRHWKALPGADHRSPDYRAWPAAPSTRDGYPKQCVLGFARVVGCVDLPAEQRIASGAMVISTARRAEAVQTLERIRVWGFGPHVWILDPSVIRLAVPIRIPKGTFKLWPLDDKRVAMPAPLQAQLRAALVAGLRDRGSWRTAA